jgi:multicomponent Na+:H+ antiporter subunit B
VIGRYPSEIVRVTSVLLAPFILLFGLYVIAHGHYGPGGGFAGGVALAVGVILLRIVGDEAQIARRFPSALGVACGALGMLLFLGIGLAPMLVGGAFLEYAATPGAGDPVAARYVGILVVEIAVGLAVFGTLVAIFDVVAGRRSASAGPPAVGPDGPSRQVGQAAGEGSG